MKKVLVLALLFGLAVGALAQQPRMGAWVDEVIFTEEPSLAAAIRKLEVNEIDVYAFSIADPELFKRVVEHPDLTYFTSFGSYNELTFNPAGPTFRETWKLNPFWVPRIREAMNWLIDRDYIASEIMGGLAVPRYLPITGAFPDYTRYLDKVKELEAKYAYDLAKAEAIITEEMVRFGARKVDGKWYWCGEPVTLIILIRVEDERRIIGDYVATILEDLGFTVERQYKTSKEASPIWIGTDPAEGKFHIYTGGWVTTVISRDQGDNFDFFYTSRGLPFPLWQAYTPAPGFDEVAKRLALRDYTSMVERKELFEKALELSMEDSVRVWLTDAQGFSPYRKNVGIAADLAGGIYGAYLWALTAQFWDKESETFESSVRLELGAARTVTWDTKEQRNVRFIDITYNKELDVSFKDDTGKELATDTGKTFTFQFLSTDVKRTHGKDERIFERVLKIEAKAGSLTLTYHYIVEGGTMRISMPSLLVEPWNPIAGSDWIYDMMPIRATADWGTVWDPTNGLWWPQRIERAEVYIQEGLPVEKTLDWVTLTFVPEIRVPEDAWCDWDAVNQRFITVGEKFPEGLTARRKSVVYYPADLYKVPLHDGSKISIADFILGMILTFDRAKPESAIFDEAAVPGFESFMETFRGIRIVSEDPLVIEYYSDTYYLDAEWCVADLFPYYDYGPGFWHTLALGIMAEANKELAFSSDKAEKLKVEWTNYIAGPSLAILEKYLDEAIATGYIPYANTLGNYITAEEAAERYANLKAWYEAKGHFWVASGPLYLEKAYPIEKVVHLKRFPDFPDPAEKWQRFVVEKP